MTLAKISNGDVAKENNKELDLEKVNERKGYLISKRCMDIIGALCGLVLLSPVFIIIAFLIKYEDSKGPILFKQIRVGKGGKKFYMYKFRSMVTDAEERLKDLLQYNEVSGAMFKMKEDPRVTKIGKFIRKTSIDELPQLLNVLKGEMSLVGPRPPLPREVKEYTQYDKQRLLVTPGCAGLWQVTERNSVGFKEMVELDLEYINKRSIVYDLKIIFKTIQIMIKSNGAS
ncbi:sugar transferase [Bacillus cereus]|uniref:sugar transferase n=1 Tax=Bacillus cereus TaxID=1396 RepID=UPI000BEC9F58|nr:sugar transferase [Bacillus cereus]MEB8800483.1 sugar transferase [Bacillus cereus]PDY06695.1 multidrug MFS transporter [Bacillus cereus]PEX22212.1 multidrug MFS transporter [Bacillus cereus]PFC38770.1 multidrug MFS transporter [Bacillus cereus]PFK67330.1 multidrug MFS transporter [Bacillus cereus]